MTKIRRGTLFSRKPCVYIQTGRRVREEGKPDELMPKEEMAKK